MKQRLLIVEDDLMVQSLLAAYLQREGFLISLASTGKEMLACADSEKLDMILLDLGLPDEDGLTLARQIRARSNLPIIVLTARLGKSDRLAALEVGADDYMTKPFDPEELILRIRNLLGRAAGSEGKPEKHARPEVFRFSGWNMDLAAHSVTNPDGQQIPFTRAEFNLMAALVKAPNRVLSRAYLLDAVSQDADSPTDRLIDVLISRIRKKIEINPRQPEIIVTVLGCGYKFSADMS
jgi:two-component system, OmpR family, response regulator